MKKMVFLLALAAPVAAMAQLADSSQRVIHVAGTVNFRDIGGYKTNDGKSVKWGKIYRSADVSHLTNADLDTLSARHIHTVVDFRGIKESAKAPDHILPNTDYTLCPAGSDSLPDMRQMIARIKSGSNAFLSDMYSNPQYLGARYKPFFQKLLTLKDTSAIMYHCTGGRDRTGMATALLLYALKVPESTIEADFTASNVYLQPMYHRMFQGAASDSDVALLQKTIELRPELIRSMFTGIQDKYGSVENFMKQELGVGDKELKILRARYTN